MKEAPVITTSHAALHGKKIGVQSGTTGQAWAKENLSKGAKIVPFKDATDAFAALQAGNVDAVVNDLPVTAELVKDGPTSGFDHRRGDPDRRAVRLSRVAKDNPEL